jgi:exopolysaccharide production protein ExoZ
VTDTGRKLGWLQALRGFAAVGVVTCHCLINLPKDVPHPGLFAVLYQLGAGVDLFFVISGFIIVHATQGDPGGFRSAARFAFRRLRRIWPAYFVLTLVIGFSSLGWSLIGDEENRLRLVKSILFIPVNYDTVYAHQIIAQGWTLGFEVYFYGIFAISLLFARARWLFLAAWWSVTLVAVPLAFHASLTDGFQSYAATVYPVEYLKLATNPYIWGFVAGGIAGLIYHSALRIESAGLCSALVLAAVAFAIWNTFDSFVPGSVRVGLGFAMMIAVVSVASKTIEIRVPRVLSYLGDISYTLYLEHLAVIYVLQFVYLHLGLKAELSTFAHIPVMVAACILVAALSSRFLEQDLPRVLLPVDPIAPENGKPNPAVVSSFAATIRRFWFTKAME